jgi:dTDP-glucose 4,6-dehydratase
MDESFTGFKEWDRLNPNNPYAAAKAAAEMAVISFANTYQMPIVITNTMNVYGERQHPEKYVPMCIKKCLDGEKIMIHSTKDKLQAGKRHYLHARNISAATLWVIENGKLLDGSAAQGRYNIVGEVEVDNLAMAQKIHGFVKEWADEKGIAVPDLNYEMVDFHSSRPGHDLRYALDGKKLADEGFTYPTSFEESLRKMVRWTLNHQEWL